MTQAFGARLKTFRKQQRLSQSKLGRAVGVHYNQIGLYERGTAMPSVTVLAALAKALGITADVLLHDHPPAPPSPNATPAPAAPTATPGAPSAADTRLTELIHAARALNEPDRRAVIALLEAFVFKSRIAALAAELQNR